MSSTGTLGKYQIIREIARSNDIVYEAYDPAMNRRVALKELNLPSGIGDKQREERRARFQREAKAAGSLSHPNIVTIFEVGEDAGRPYLAMEYLEGSNLRQRLDVEGKLDDKTAVDIAVQVLAGLQFAHDHGVVHRDVKPENIQLLPDGRVKLTDFGIARLMFEPTLTIDGQVFGTPSYMSPEQVVGKDIDARTDVFSTGIILYEALTGKKPFVGDNVVAISHAITHLQPPDPQGIAFGLVQILRKAMEKSPDARYASAKDMAAALKAEVVQPQQAPPPQPSVYGPNPYGPPPMGAPYGPPPPQTQQPVPTGSPYGQPYHQPPPASGPQYQQIMLPPFPPGWAAPPKPRPLLSPATSSFLWRTFWVIVIGSIIAVAGFFALAELSEMTTRREQERQSLIETQQLLDRAGEVRAAASRGLDSFQRFNMFVQSLELFEEAAAKAPTREDAAVIAVEASRTARLASREAWNVRDLRVAEYYAQASIRWADASGDAQEMSDARRFFAEMSGG